MIPNDIAQKHSRERFRSVLLAFLQTSGEFRLSGVAHHYWTFSLLQTYDFVPRDIQIPAGDCHCFSQPVALLQTMYICSCSTYGNLNFRIGESRYPPSGEDLLVGCTTRIVPFEGSFSSPKYSLSISSSFAAVQYFNYLRAEPHLVRMEADVLTEHTESR